MSDYEQYSGKIRKVPTIIGETFEQQEKRLSLENGCQPDLYYEGWLFDEFYKRFLHVERTIYEIYERVEEDYNDSYIDILDNKDGTYTFKTRFYNGGACLSEMVQIRLKLDYGA